MVTDGYKQTDVGVIPKDWEYSFLSDVVFSISSGKSNTISTGSNFPIYGSTGIIGHRQKFDYSGQRILVARVGANAGKVYKVDGEYCVSDNTLMIKCREDFNFEYTFHFLIQANLSSLVFGSGQPLITGGQLKTIDILIPPKQEQQAIATALSDTDELINSLEKLIAKKEAIKTGTMQELLTGKKRLDGFSGDWEEKTILSITNNIIDYRGVTPKKKGMDWGDGNIVALSAGNVKKGYIDFNAECYYGSEELYKKWMTNGDAVKDDIVFTMEAPLGNVALIPDNKKYILSQRTILLQMDRNKYDTKYIFQVFKSKKFQNYIYNSATGSTAKGIKRKIFESLLISIPKELEQQAISQILSEMDYTIDILKTKLSKIKAIKEGMMQELLTGKTRLKV